MWFLFLIMIAECLYFKIILKTLYKTMVSNYVGRIDKLERIQQYISNCYDNKHGGALYFSGQPGTGKTSMAHHLIKIMQFDTNAYTICNVAQCQSLRDIWCFLEAAIHRSQFRTADEEKAKKRIQQYLKTENKHLLILDEIDLLVNFKNTDLFTTLQDWTSYSSGFILIAISNTYNVFNTFFNVHLQAIETPSQARNHDTRLSLHFDPYTTEEMEMILTETYKSNSTIHISPSAITLCARQASSTGDVRKAIQLCEAAVKFAQSIDSSSIISLQHVMSILKTHAHQQGIIPRIQSLNVHMKCVLIALINILRSNHKVVGTKRKYVKSKVIITEHNLYSEYTKCTRIGLSPQTRHSFVDLLNALEAHSLISFQPLKRKSFKSHLSKFIQLEADITEVESGIKEPYLKTFIDVE